MTQPTKRLGALLLAILLGLGLTGCPAQTPPTGTTAMTTASATATTPPATATTPTATTAAPPPSSTATPPATGVPGPTTSAAPAYTVDVAAKAGLGSYLVDGRGRTLYYTTSDRPNYSNLPDETLTSWPVFYAAALAVPPSLDAASFGTYTRDNGVKQTTYKGYPLYYFFQDKARGDTLGHLLGGVWFALRPDQPLP